MSDYGCDPLGDGMFRMVPSGDVVDAKERAKRLGEAKVKANDCLGLSWEELAMKQGGLNTLDITKNKNGN